MERKHTQFDDLEDYHETGLTEVVETLYNEETDEWLAEFDRYEAGSTEHELSETEAAVMTLTSTAGYPEGSPELPDGVPQHEAEYSILDANAERGNNGPFYVNDDMGQVAVELELGRARMTEDGDSENERGSLILEPNQ